MYSSCLYCHGNLGRNESVEHFPVGRRLAFDAANGRLWVICSACRRWNLSPLEERWNAIDECERLFERTRLRMSTDNIGLARIAEGTELVRVGAAMRPEMAAWRFGAQLAARRRRYAWLVGGGVVAAAGIYAGTAAAGVSFFAGSGVWKLVKGGYERATQLVLPMPAADDPLRKALRSPTGEILLPSGRRRSAPRIETKHTRDARLLVGADDHDVRLAVSVVGGGNVNYVGAEAHGVTPKLLAKLNRSGGTKADERQAVSMLEGVASDRVPDLFIALLRRYASSTGAGKTLKDLGAPITLALEMSLQEQRERELLAGELLDLEFAWREAEELARIADSLGSSAVDRALAKLKAKLTG